MGGGDKRLERGGGSFARPKSASRPGSRSGDVVTGFTVSSAAAAAVAVVGASVGGDIDTDVPSTDIRTQQLLLLKGGGWDSLNSQGNQSTPVKEAERSAVEATEKVGLRSLSTAHPTTVSTVSIESSGGRSRAPSVNEVNGTVGFYVPSAALLSGSSQSQEKSAPSSSLVCASVQSTVLSPEVIRLFGMTPTFSVGSRSTHARASDAVIGAAAAAEERIAVASGTDTAIHYDSCENPHPDDLHCTVSADDAISRSANLTARDDPGGASASGSMHELEFDSESGDDENDGWMEDTDPPYGFVTQTEYDAIKQVPAASDHEMLDLFLRLCQYFRGEHPLEEVMWRENLSRQQLGKLLSSFSEVLTRITR